MDIYSHKRLILWFLFSTEISLQIRSKHKYFNIYTRTHKFIDDWNVDRWLYIGMGINPFCNCNTSIWWPIWRSHFALRRHSSTEHSRLRFPWCYSTGRLMLLALALLNHLEPMVRHMIHNILDMHSYLSKIVRNQEFR